MNRPHAESFSLMRLTPPVICPSREHVFFDDSLPYTNILFMEVGFQEIVRLGL